MVIDTDINCTDDFLEGLCQTKKPLIDLKENDFQSSRCVLYM